VYFFSGQKAHAISPASTIVIPAMNRTAFEEDAGGSGAGGAGFFMRAPD
jgi:hypothetical protein